MAKRKIYRLKWRNIFILLLILTLIIVLFNTFINIYKWKKDSIHTNKQLEKIETKIKVEQTKDNENTEIIEQDKIDEKNPYWDYIKMDLINVDFKELKKINKNTKGWIQVNGTNINYPFVQYNDNEYYLKHSFDNKYNSGGWIFLDYRNNLENLNKNTIIYGHSRKDTTMFGSLKNILKSEWLKNSNNFVIKLSDEYQNTLWQVFSVYHIPVTNDYLYVDFNNETEFVEFSNIILNRSMYDFKTSISKDDYILTLSTCYGDEERVVLHAKLIKKEIR